MPSFTKMALVEVWTQEKTKVDYLWHRFEKVKIISKFSKDYGIYSFRHSAAIDLVLFVYETRIDRAWKYFKIICLLLVMLQKRHETTLCGRWRYAAKRLRADYTRFNKFELNQFFTKTIINNSFKVIYNTNWTNKTQQIVKW
jgi:hypothetical protein